jgi:hypothetical protein
MLTVRQTLSTAAAAAALLAGACQSGEGDKQAVNSANAVQQQTVPRLAIPVPKPPLDREQLLVASLRAATAFAAGADDPELQRNLADRKFEFRIRFGCEGAGEPDANEPLGWTYDPKTRALKVRAAPALSLKDAPVKAIAGEAFEAVEGFWLRRPWLLSPVCLRAQENAAADSTSKGGPFAEPPPQNVGIAQFFTKSEPRTLRRSGRPYEATTRLETDQPPTGGFDLVLAGRLVALPDGRVIACTRSPDGERPACLISVEFGKVSIERADTHEQIAQWSSG